MSSYATALDIAAKLTAAGVDATVDPRSVQPPCLLVAPPSGVIDIMCDAATGTWSVYALVPNPANPDSWRALDQMLAVTADTLPVERWDFISYILSPDNPPLPAYRIQFDMGFDL